MHGPNRPTPAPGALPELPPLPEPSLEVVANTPMRVHSVQQIQDYARAYAEQCRAGVVVTDAMVERAADAISKVRCLGPMKECHSLMARAAIQSAFADDEGVKS